jgi:hypothetical protein
MKYFLDTEFIEGFHKPLLGKRRHFIDLISIGIVSEDNRGFEFISNEYKWSDADKWVQDNVIIPLYVDKVRGDNRNRLSASNFHLHIGESNAKIAQEIKRFVYTDKPSKIQFYGYYSDYDWVLFCSLFGRMIHLPNGFPMYCYDLKQMMADKGVDSSHPNCPKLKKEHSALHDAAWNKEVYNWLKTVNPNAGSTPDR